MNKTVTKIKRINSSGVFFVAALAFTLGAIASALGTGAISTGFTNTFAALKASQPILSSVEENLLPVFTSMPTYLYIQAAFALVVVVGMWMHFFANKTRQDSVSTTGITLIKVCKYIELVLTVAAYLLCAIVLVMTSLVLVEAIHEIDPAATTVSYIIFGVLAALYLLALLLTVLYYRGIFHTIKAIKMTLSTGVIMGKVSLFVIVANYFLAAGTLVGAILSPTIWGLASGLLEVVGLVFLSISMASLRSEMRYIASRGGDSVQ